MVLSRSKRWNYFVVMTVMPSLAKQMTAQEERRKSSSRGDAVRCASVLLYRQQTDADACCVGGLIIFFIYFSIISDYFSGFIYLVPGTYLQVLGC